MKKTLLLLSLLLSFGLFSCSDDDDPNPQTEPEEIEEINTMDAYIPFEKKGNTKNNILVGRGYDFTGTYLSSESAREAIIDLDRFIEENPYSYYYDSTTSGSSYTLSGSNAWDYVKRLTSASNNEYWNIIPDNIAAFTGTIVDNEFFKLKEGETSSTYSFSSTHIYFIINRIKIFPDAKNLSLYMTESFKNDLKTLSADKIIEKYGTHLITHYSAGGRLDIIYRSKIEPAFYYEKELAVRVGSMQASFRLGVGLFHFDSDTESAQLLEANKVPIVYVISQGGNNSIACGAYNLQKEFSRLEYNEWAKSVTEENAELVDMELNSLIPIYELVTDSKKQAEIKTAVEKYIEDRQVVQ